ncbi:MAG TPA: hypothetical protein PKY29_04475 [Ferruginibacter sp.]|nr:hypothetical protein [Ferruginibacter sp.]HRQ20544.1 hypothetical protein [Ferruginibacter sp.]
MALVKINSISDAATINNHFVTVQVNEHTVVCKAPEKLKVLIDALQPNCCTHYVSDGYWSMHDLVMSLLKKYNQPADLYITTYAIREYAVRQLLFAAESGLLKKINLLVDYRAKVRTPEVFQLIENVMSEVFLTRVHAKVCVIKLPDLIISIVGSSNWTTNPKIEAGTISLNKEVGEFNIKWITEIMQDAEPFK